MKNHCHETAHLVEVAWNPEFLRESLAIEDTLRPDRLVLGFGPGRFRAETTLREAFEKIIDTGTPTIVTDWVTAELAKGAANSFLAVGGTREYQLPGAVDVRYVHLRGARRVTSAPTPPPRGRSR
jgi:UDP-glucose 6-dehydrogenase